MDPHNNPTNTSEEALAAAIATWRAQVERDLKGAPFEKRLITRTPEGIALNPLYTRADIPAGVKADERPGEGTMRRGSRPAAARTACRRLQAIRRADASAFNQTLRAALMAGQDAVVVPGTKELASGDWAPASLNDLAVALRNVELSAVPVHFPVSAAALPAIAMLVAYAEESGLNLAGLVGSTAADPVAEVTKTGKAPEDWAAILDDVASSIRWSRAKAPGLRTLAVDGTLWTDAGANAVQELGLVLAAVADYARALERREITLAQIMPSLVVKFGIGPRFFMELAKFRAWRVLLTKLLVGLGADATDAAQVELHAATGNWNKTRLDKHVNLLRATTESLSAVLGGVDGLCIDPFDTVTGETSAVGERVARNLHILIGEEFGFNEPADAAGGSWYVENLTDQLARKAWSFFQQIESQGGLRSALAQGWVQAQLAATTKARDGDFSIRRSGLIGTNIFPNARDEIEPAPNAGKDAGMVRLAAIPATDWSARLGSMVDALRAGATLAELESTETVATVTWDALPRYVASAPFDALRLSAQDLALSRGKGPTAFLARMGPVKQHKPRADFSAGFLSVAGFSLLGKTGYDDAASAAAAAIESGADAVVICSTDDTYPELVPPLARAIKAAKPKTQIVLAGLPRDDAMQALFSEAGVDEFIHVRANVPTVLGRMLNRIGSNL